ncbi:MAG: DNA-binding protein [Microbacteriaceae bacterium]|nr:DNA-binding protein [Microbacteriaceae bacterium]
MFVITSDQRSSRSTPSESAAAIAALTEAWAEQLVLPAERSAGDEIQLVTASADAALGIILQLTRTKRWSVGLGVGKVDLSHDVRESTGDAFVAARGAVSRAKKRVTHFGLEREPESTRAAHVESLVDLLLLLRQRRTRLGWELYDIVSNGATQTSAAEILGITAQSVSDRAIAAGLRTEEAATVALASLIDMLDTEAADR